MYYLNISLTNGDILERVGEGTLEDLRVLVFGLRFKLLFEFEYAGSHNVIPTNHIVRYIIEKG